MQSMKAELPTHGRVLWLTGLSGAGKSTIAAEIQKLLIEQGITPLVLDGDQVRRAIADPHWGFDQQSRLMGSYRYARLAALFASQGHTVIVPTISMFHEVQQWNRKHSPHYFEVYLRTTEETRRNRDPKVLYQQHKQGTEVSMAGLDLTIQEPLNPDLLIDNNGDQSVIAATVKLILQQFLSETDTGKGVQVDE
ncbi:MAG: adenylyl-sulfate kinase [Gammaproteobacteria bacterium]|nr:adenylyl-sulfate kinase [Gammaproteobacteria bacterium]